MSFFECFSPGVAYDQYLVPLLVRLLMPGPSLFWTGDRTKTLIRRYSTLSSGESIYFKESKIERRNS
ncbi:hypothetical protein V6N13_033761 [Hibiscus sabdariffa]|uniref:Uncharacterized protein n=1 Tax=Hibiscus sabdariffa TaxID=183260 RepID=A0ABR2F9K8_9ROSI